MISIMIVNKKPNVAALGLVTRIDGYKKTIRDRYKCSEFSFYKLTINAFFLVKSAFVPYVVQF